MKYLTGDLDVYELEVLFEVGITPAILKELETEFPFAETLKIWNELKKEILEKVNKEKTLLLKKMDEARKKNISFVERKKTLERIGYATKLELKVKNKKLPPYAEWIEILDLSHLQRMGMKEFLRFMYL